jgi:enoyl-CoA hydratase
MDLGVEKLIGRKEGAIGWMIFNNPERRNAVSLDMWRAIPDVIAAFETDPEVRVVVFTGAGDKAFVSGADISQFEAERTDATAEARYSGASGAANAAMAGLSKPSIAMIRGYCIGGGLAVALQTDIRICETGSRFAIPAARLGLGYGFGGVKALIDIVGPAIAKEILFTARQFDAQEALRVGLVNRVSVRRHDRRQRPAHRPRRQDRRPRGGPRREQAPARRRGDRRRRLLRLRRLQGRPHRLHGETQTGV